MRIGDWVKAERKRRDWSQAGLAQRARLSQQAIYLLESHKRPNPGAVTLEKLAGAFEVSVDELMQRVGGVGAAQSEEVLGSRLDDWVHQIVALGPELTPAQRLAVLEHAQALRGQNGPLP